ncbi:MAG: hypothetical protein ACXWDN_00845 [Limisphaerales bacterium]
MILLRGLIVVLLTSTCFNASAADSFEAGFAKLHSRVTTDPSPTNIWSPHLRLLVGVEATEGSKKTVCFVELTTIKPPATTTTTGKPWAPVLETNGFSWTSTNQSHVTTKEKFVWALYPVQARVFDASGRQFKEGTTTVPFGLLTNGLAQVCRLGLGGGRAPEETPENMRAFFSGFFWMSAMMGRLQGAPVLHDVWENASCCFRWPSLWTMTRAAVGGGMVIELDPNWKKIAVVSTNEPLRYVLPITLGAGGRVLTKVEIIVGQATAAAALLGGIESLEATHPTRPDHKYTARVLASGIAID